MWKKKRKTADQNVWDRNRLLSYLRTSSLRNEIPNFLGPSARLYCRLGLKSFWKTKAVLAALLLYPLARQKSVSISIWNVLFRSPSSSNPPQRCISNCESRTGATKASLFCQSLVSVSLVFPVKDSESISGLMCLLKSLTSYENHCLPIKVTDLIQKSRVSGRRDCVICGSERETWTL